MLASCPPSSIGTKKSPLPRYVHVSVIHHRFCTRKIAVCRTEWCYIIFSLYTDDPLKRDEHESYYLNSHFSRWILLLTLMSGKGIEYIQLHPVHLGICLQDKACTTQHQNWIETCPVHMLCSLVFQCLVGGTRLHTGRTWLNLILVASSQPHTEYMESIRWGIFHQVDIRLYQSVFKKMSKILF